MKKLLLLSSLLALSFSAFALDPMTPSGVTPRQMVFLTNNTTTIYGFTNVQFITAPGNLVYSLTTNTIIPTYVGGTTINGLNYGGTAYWTNTITTNAVVAGQAWDDVPLVPNRNADSNQNPLTLFCSVLLDNGAAPGATNLITFTFQKMLGTNMDNGSQVNYDTLSFVMNVTTNVSNTLCTNIPTTFQQGATGIRLYSVKTANSTTNSFVQLLNWGVSGFKP